MYQTESSTECLCCRARMSTAESGSSRMRSTFCAKELANVVTVPGKIESASCSNKDFV